MYLFICIYVGVTNSSKRYSAPSVICAHVYSVFSWWQLANNTHTSTHKPNANECKWNDNANIFIHENSNKSLYDTHTHIHICTAHIRPHCGQLCFYACCWIIAHGYVEELFSQFVCILGWINENITWIKFNHFQHVKNPWNAFICVCVLNWITNTNYDRMYGEWMNVYWIYIWWPLKVCVCVL